MIKLIKYITVYNSSRLNIHHIKYYKVVRKTEFEYPYTIKYPYRIMVVLVDSSQYTFGSAKNSTDAIDVCETLSAQNHVPYYLF